MNPCIRGRQFTPSSFLDGYRILCSCGDAVVCIDPDPAVAKSRAEKAWDALNPWTAKPKPAPTETIPPSVIAGQVEGIRIGGGFTKAFDVTYNDASGIDVLALGMGDVVVRGPKGVLPTQLSAMRSHPDGRVVCRYTMMAPGGLWDKADNGTYTVVLQANQVFDKQGNAAPEAVLGTFKVAI